MPGVTGLGPRHDNHRGSRLSCAQVGLKFQEKVIFQKVLCYHAFHATMGLGEQERGKNLPPARRSHTDWRSKSSFCSRRL